MVKNHRPVQARIRATTTTGAARTLQVCNECLTEWPCWYWNVEGHPTGSPRPMICHLYDMYVERHGLSPERALEVTMAYANDSDTRLPASCYTADEIAADPAAVVR